MLWSPLFNGNSRRFKLFTIFWGHVINHEHSVSTFLECIFHKFWMLHILSIFISTILFSERLVESLRVPSVPTIQAHVFFCLRVLIIRMSPQQIISLWPAMITELVSALIEFLVSLQRLWKWRLVQNHNESVLHCYIFVASGMLKQISSSCLV